MTTIVITVLLFSSLKERVGAGKVLLTVPAQPIDAARVLEMLFEEYPATAPYRDYIRVAINGEYVDLSAHVTAGDEIALITPVSGG